MQNRGLTAFVFLLALSGMGFVCAKSGKSVGMVTEAQGSAYWQNDAKRTSIKALDELPVGATLVVTKGGKLSIVYMVSGQEYELSGPSTVQFRKLQPVALNGLLPKKRGSAAAVSENKIRIEPKKVQTAGQTLVSTDKPDRNDVPAAAAPAPPMMAAPVSAPVAMVNDIAAMEAAKKAEYEAAMRAAQAADAASTAKVQTEMATARRMEAEAAARAKQMAEQNAAAEKKDCQPIATDEVNEDKTAEPQPTEAETRARDCPMITF